MLNKYLRDCMVLFQSREPLCQSPVCSFCSFDTLITENLRGKAAWGIDAAIVVSRAPWRYGLCICAHWCHGHQLTWTRALRDLIEGPLLIIVCISPVPRSITVWALCFRVSRSYSFFWKVSSLSSEHAYPYYIIRLALCAMLVTVYEIPCYVLGIACVLSSIH